MPLPTEYPTQDCSIARALEVVGERWTLLVVREALLGATSFEQFSEALGIATNTLTSRLERLVGAGVLERRPDPHDGRRRHYALTPAGRELGLVIQALRQWGDKHGGAAPPVSIAHVGCGGELEVGYRCSACGEALDPPADVARRVDRPTRVR